MLFMDEKHQIDDSLLAGELFVFAHADPEPMVYWQRKLLSQTTANLSRDQQVLDCNQER